MLIRIVKMTFRNEEAEIFLLLFDEVKFKIKNFEGCEHLELWRDSANANVFFTYSWWQNETALNKYRHSDLFADTWRKTKILFAAKAEAWSVDQIYSAT